MMIQGGHLTRIQNGRTRCCTWKTKMAPAWKLGSFSHFRKFHKDMIEKTTLERAMNDNNQYADQRALSFVQAPTRHTCCCWPLRPSTVNPRPPKASRRFACSLLRLPCRSRLARDKTLVASVSAAELRSDAEVEEADSRDDTEEEAEDDVKEEEEEARVSCTLLLWVSSPKSPPPPPWLRPKPMPSP